MEAFTTHSGVVAPLDRADVDTDQIIPKQFLKRVERTGYGQFLFHDWRVGDGGELRPDFALNRPELSGASILVARANFGCGSSREHAAWSLRDYGFRAILAPSFADIFQENADQNGVAAITLEVEAIETLLERASENAPYSVTVDLVECAVSDQQGVVGRFEIDAFRRSCLLEGLDRIGLTLKHEGDISAYERRRWPQGFAG